jgi:hypothetical protein
MLLTYENAYYLIINDRSIKGEYNYYLSRTCLQVFRREYKIKYKQGKNFK